MVASWPIAPGDTPTGLSIDPEHHRLFVGCENKMMVLLDSQSGKVLSTAPIGAGVDATAYDPGPDLAFASNGEGSVTIARETSPGTLEVLQTLKTEKGARTLALDTSTHKIYLPTARFDRERASAGEASAQNLARHPQSLLVFGP